MNQGFDSTRSSTFVQKRLQEGLGDTKIQGSLHPVTRTGLFPSNERRTEAQSGPVHSAWEAWEAQGLHTKVDVCGNVPKLGGFYVF